jgi:hypothetical protein
MNIYLAQVKGVDKNSGDVVDFYYTSNKYNNGGTPDYDVRISAPAFFSRSMDMGGIMGGTIATSIGELVLQNTDRNIDGLINYDFIGRTLILLYGDENGSIIDFVPILIAEISEVRFGWEDVHFIFKDYTQKLENIIQQERYLGTNSPPDGLEGEADLKDKQKPLIFGRPHNYQPIQVNKQKLIYQASSEPLYNMISVFDKGSYLSRQTDYVDLTDLQANYPDAGYFRFLPGSGYFRIGLIPDNLSITVLEKENLEDNSPAAILSFIQENYINSIDSNLSISSDDLTLLDSEIAANLGIVCGDSASIKDVIEEVCFSIGAWYGYDKNGTLRVFRLREPSGNADLEIISANHNDSPYGIYSLEIDPAIINNSAAPIWKINYKYHKNYNPAQKENLAGIVSSERINWFQEEYRIITVQDDTIKTKYPSAQEITVESNLIGSENVLVEANRLLTLYKVPRNLYIAECRLSINDLKSLDLGQKIALTFDRFGLDGTKLTILVGIELDYIKQTAKLTCWG